MIQVSGLSKRFGNTVLFTNLSFTVNDGEHVALSAPSGKGKTTLLRILCGLEKPDGGTVEGITEKTVTYQFQEPRLFESLSALENVACVLPDPKQGQSAAEELLCRLGLGDALQKRPSELSGGMKQRVALARALIVDRPIVFLDEPFTALDEDLRCDLRQFLREKLQNKTLFLVSHDPKDLQALTNREIAF